MSSCRNIFHSFWWLIIWLWRYSAILWTSKRLTHLLYDGHFHPKKFSPALKKFWHGGLVEYFYHSNLIPVKIPIWENCHSHFSYMAIFAEHLPHVFSPTKTFVFQLWKMKVCYGTFVIIGGQKSLVNLTKFETNIARGTTDPGYRVYNLNNFSDWNQFDIINQMAPLAIVNKFGHQMTPLPLVTNLATRWLHMH